MSYVEYLGLGLDAFSRVMYGVWGIGANSLQTNSGNPKTYELQESLGYMGYELQLTRESAVV